MSSSLLRIVAVVTWIAAGGIACAAESGQAATSQAEVRDLDTSFRNPPVDAGPWTYWFWINGNITREGITADLEAMARVGIRGVLIMEVGGRKTYPPPGPMAFGGPQWREMFKHAVSEARRLGLQLSMNNDAGWCGSGGPWNTPEYSMQKLVSTKTRVRGGERVELALPKPKEAEGFYRDVKVLAYRELGKGAAAAAVASSSVLDVSGKMDPSGKLLWDAPEGDWIALRVGHTSTGRKNHPAPAAGAGLECDKYSREAAARHYDGFIAQLAEDVGSDAGITFTMTHIDSWEVGDQDWTPRMFEEFRRRRGYDLTPWLISMCGGPALGSDEQTRRFLRDFRRTESELNDEAYAGTIRKLAHARGMGLSIEGYGPTAATINPLTYGAQADLPMGEFWVMRWGAWHLLSSRLMASVAHAEGKRIVGAESFTTIGANDPWTEHPYSIKTTGDWAFCEGVNRFVFHRAALQPWQTLVPGMTMSNNGTHFDRTQTWWEQSAAWIRYLTRCQYLLQQGEFVADVCRLVPDGENYGHSPKMVTLPGQFAPLPADYNYDYLSDAALADASVRDGRIVLPSGMSYRLLQLPDYEAITPELLRKVRDLVHGGATVWGPRPTHSPSLSGYPDCDAEVGAIANKLWGTAPAASPGERPVGAGRVIWNQPLEEVLRGLSGGPDFAFTVDPKPTDAAIESPTIGRGKTMGKEPPGLMPTAGLNWIHRRIGDADIYFIANPQHRPVESVCRFRVESKRPELWDPITGEIRRAAVFTRDAVGVQVPIHFDPAGSVFVVFRDKVRPEDQVVSVRHGGRSLFGGDGERPHELPIIWCENGKVSLRSTEAGRYEFKFADGASRAVEVAAVSAPRRIGGPWKVSFQPGRGALVSTELSTLVDWSRSENEGIRYFSGAATYVTYFDGPGQGPEDVRCQLDLGDVRVIAEVRLNGHDLGVLWKPPFIVDVTRALKTGRNELEVRVTNLWPNRLIGDEQYPDDCTPGGTWRTGALPVWPEWLLHGRPRPEPRRITFTTWKYYTKDSPLLPSGLLGPVTLKEEAEASAPAR